MNPAPILQLAAAAACSLFLAGAASAAPGATDERDFFAGIEARNVGPFRGGRATAAAGVRDHPHIYYMGTTGGVWKTENAGGSWFAISDKDFASAAVGAIAVAPSDPNVIVVGMGESPFRNIASSQGDGVYKSTDGGRHWAHLGFEQVRQVGEIHIHPQNPDIIWVAAQGNTYAEADDDAGVFKSIDGGASWRRVLIPQNGSTGAVDLALDMSNPRILYAALWDNQRSPWALRSGGDGSGIWRSRDGGERWERLTEGLPGTMGKIGVAASPAQPGRVWAIVETEGDEAGLYRSDDGGDSWTLINADRVLHARSWYYMHVFADPNDGDTVYVLNAPFMKSIDGGKSFTEVATPHGDNHYLWINPDNSDWMVNANDGGANVSFDGGASWSRQDNQATAQFYRVNTDNAFEYRIYGGQQDNSTVAIKSRSRDGVIGRDDWEIHGGCESAYVAMNPDDARYTYAGCYLGLIDEFDTRTRTNRSIKVYAETGLGQLTRDARYRFNWNAPIHVSVHDPKVIYHGANVLLKSTNRGYDWTEVSPDLTRDEDDKQGRGAGPFTNENIEQYNTIFAFAESPHDAATLWVGSDDGLVHVTRDAGATWSEVSPHGLDRGLVNSIEVSPHDPASVYVVAMKYKEGDQRPYVFKSADYGKSWRDFRGNLPVVPVTDLMLRRQDLVLATQGRAFWVIDDISPLRQYRVEHETAPLVLYEPEDAWRLTPTPDHSGGGESTAPSAPGGALIYYALPEAPDLESDTLTLEIRDVHGNLVRTLKSDAETGIEGGENALPAEAGINRVVWDLRSDSATKLDYDVAFGAGDDKTIAGYHIAPGQYSLKLALGDEVAESQVTVHWDPINTYDVSTIAEQQAFLAENFEMIDALYRRVARLQSVVKQVELRKSLAEHAGDDALAEAAQTLLTALETWQKSVTTPQRKTFQDVINFHPRIDSFLIDLCQQADSAVLGLTSGQKRRLSDLRPEWQEAMEAWDALQREDIAAFNALAGPAITVPDRE